MNLLFWLFIGYIFYRIFKGYMRFQQHYYRAGQFSGIAIDKEQIANSELGLFVALMAKVAKADGRIDELEAELISNTFTDIAKAFPQSERVREILKEIFSTEKHTTDNIDEICIRLQQLTQREPQKRIMMLTFLTNLAFIDGHFSSEEESIILKIATLLRIDSSRIEAIMQQFAQIHKTPPPQTTLNEAYGLLGADKNEEMKSIKRKYRELVKKYHPDMMQAKGASEEYVRDATQKMQKINAAYEMIREARK
jgi:DnaJ like chaperone protein